MPIAVNVGDGMLALSMRPCSTTRSSSAWGKALRVLDTVSRMARESAEGQMIELDWIARRRLDAHRRELCAHGLQEDHLVLASSRRSASAPSRPERPATA